jgi:hypothetical protein
MAEIMAPRLIGLTNMCVAKSAGTICRAPNRFECLFARLFFVHL